MPMYEVVNTYGIFYIVKCDRTKFIYNNREYKYWQRRKFKQQDAKAICSFLNNIKYIKKSKKKNYDILNYNKHTKKLIFNNINLT